jgi:hypothetical protein
MNFSCLQRKCCKWLYQKGFVFCVLKEKKFFRGWVADIVVVGKGLDVNIKFVRKCERNVPTQIEYHCIFIDERFPLVLCTVSNFDDFLFCIKMIFKDKLKTNEKKYGSRPAK